MFPIFANDDGITFCLDKINLLFNSGDDGPKFMSDKREERCVVWQFMKCSAPREFQFDCHSNEKPFDLIRFANYLLCRQV